MARSGSPFSRWELPRAWKAPKAFGSRRNECAEIGNGAVVVAPGLVDPTAGEVGTRRVRLQTDYFSVVRNRAFLLAYVVVCLAAVPIGFGAHIRPQAQIVDHARAAGDRGIGIVRHSASVEVLLI